MAELTVGMMTFSFNGMLRDGAIDLPGLIRYCATLGVEDMDIAGTLPGSPAGEISSVQAALDETGIGVASSHFGLDLVTRGAAAKVKRERELREFFAILGQIRCRAVMLGSPVNDLSPEQWRRDYGLGLAEAVVVAEDYGLTVTFESRGGSMGQYVGTD